MYIHIIHCNNIIIDVLQRRWHTSRSLYFAALYVAPNAEQVWGGQFLLIIVTACHTNHLTKEGHINCKHPLYALSSAVNIMTDVFQDHKGMLLLLHIDSGDAVGVLCASLRMLQLVIRRKEPGFLSQGANIYGRYTRPLIVQRNFDWLISYDHSPCTVPIPSLAIYIYMDSFNP
jgi:hypothetical protein